MEIRLEPAPHDQYPLAALLVPGADPRAWLQAAGQLGLRLEDLRVYPLPGRHANTVWGCLFWLRSGRLPAETGPYLRCQVAEGLLLFPERSRLLPAILPGELDTLLRGVPHLLHPAIGYVSLEAEADWERLIAVAGERQPGLRRPEDGAAIPEKLQSLQLAFPGEEQALEALQSEFPEKEPLPEKNLSFLEKMKLSAYKALFSGGQGGGRDIGSSGSGKPPGWLAALAGLFGKAAGGLMERMQADFDELARRNQSEVDKLKRMLDKDPLEALRYALPLDEEGTGRGEPALFKMGLQWTGFSLFGNRFSGGGGGRAALADDTYYQLQQQYRKTAKDLIEKGLYDKAAFVYLRLLKDHRLAAETLEQGGYHSEAASVYLKYLHDKRAAAQCLVNGKMYSDAIALYIELNEHETVGDLYRQLHQEKEARYYYEQKSDQLVKAQQFLQAAKLREEKLHEPEKASALLLDGWRAGRDSELCLRRWCALVPDDRQLVQRLEVMSAEDVHAKNSESFLQVLRHLHSGRVSMEADVRRLAIDHIVRFAGEQPGLVGKLPLFDPDNKLLPKDVLRFRGGRKL